MILLVLPASALRDTYSSLLAFKRQPYVYSYRLKLLALKYGPSRTILKHYVGNSLRKTRREVERLGNLSFESISSNPLLVHNHLTHLYALCRLCQPTTVVETGVGLGASSNFILQALQDNGFGELYSIDLPKSTYFSDEGIRINEHEYTSKDDMPGSLIYDNLRERWNLVLGKSQTELPKLCNRLGTIDLFFHDSEHTYGNMWDEYETVWPYMAEKGVLASHDINWNTAFTDFVAMNKKTATTSRDGFGYIINQA